jgi:hypothetical protein
MFQITSVKMAYDGASCSHPVLKPSSVLNEESPNQGFLRQFSTITIADRILVFQNGRIAADGTHDELRGSNAIYQAMMGGAL